MRRLGRTSPVVSILVTFPAQQDHIYSALWFLISTTPRSRGNRVPEEERYEIDYYGNTPAIEGRWEVALFHILIDVIGSDNVRCLLFFSLVSLNKVFFSAIRYYYLQSSYTASIIWIASVRSKLMGVIRVQIITLLPQVSAHNDWQMVIVFLCSGIICFG